VQERVLRELSMSLQDFRTPASQFEASPKQSPTRAVGKKCVLEHNGVLKILIKQRMYPSTLQNNRFSFQSRTKRSLFLRSANPSSNTPIRTAF